MAYTTPTTRATNDNIGAAAWNADIVENIKFLANPPKCQVYKAANQSINNTTETPITFGNENWDTDTCHDNATNTSRLTCNTAGTYLVIARLTWANNATGYRLLRLFKNGVLGTLLDGDYLPSVSANTESTNLCVVETSLVVGDYVEMWGTQSSGGALNAKGSTDGFSTVFGWRMISQ